MAVCDSYALDAFAEQSAFMTDGHISAMYLPLLREWVIGLCANWSKRFFVGSPIKKNNDTWFAIALKAWASAHAQILATAKASPSSSSALADLANSRLRLFRFAMTWQVGIPANWSPIMNVTDSLTKTTVASVEWSTWDAGMGVAKNGQPYVTSAKYDAKYWVENTGTVYSNGTKYNQPPIFVQAPFRGMEVYPEVASQIDLLAATVIAFNSNKP